MTARERKTLGPTLAAEVEKMEAAAKVVLRNLRKAKAATRRTSAAVERLAADRDCLLAALIAVRDMGWNDSSEVWGQVRTALAGR